MGNGHRLPAVVVRALAGSCLLGASALGQDVLYIDDDAPGGGDGLSWAAPLNDLRDGIAYAWANPETAWTIRMAGGTFHPDAGTGEREWTFQLLDGMTIEGGYRGLAGGGDPDDRDVGTFATVLSGDIGTPGDRLDNSFHVVTGPFSGSAVLSGLSITLGHADGDPPRDLGGGLYLVDGAVTLDQCTVIDNHAFRGGGIYNFEGTLDLIASVFSLNSSVNTGGAIRNQSGGLTLFDCHFDLNTSSSGGAIGTSGVGTEISGSTFVGNSSSNSGGALNMSDGGLIRDSHFEFNTGNSGGAVWAQQNSVLRLEDSTFSDNSAIGHGGAVAAKDVDVSGCDFLRNSAVSDGGALHCFDQGPILDCSFTDNTSNQDGGALYLQSSPEVRRCVFVGNSSARGGAAFGGSPNFMDCTYVQNDATEHGGALYFDSGGGIRAICRSTFDENTAQLDGGAVYIRSATCAFASNSFRGNVAQRNGAAVYSNDDSDTVFVNCAFTGNHAMNHGGALYFNDGSDGEISNCTLALNTAAGFGGGLYVFGSAPTLGNSILWGNTPDQVLDINLLVTMDYCNVDGGWPLGRGNIEADPLFLDADGLDDVPGTADDNVRLSPSSPSIDTGSNDLVPRGIVTDLDGNPRFLSQPRFAGSRGRVDMGAHESRGAVEHIDAQQ